MRDINYIIKSWEKRMPTTPNQKTPFKNQLTKETGLNQTQNVNLLQTSDFQITRKLAMQYAKL